MIAEQLQDKINTRDRKNLIKWRMNGKEIDDILSFYDSE